METICGKPDVNKLQESHTFVLMKISFTEGKEKEEEEIKTMPLKPLPPTKPDKRNKWNERIY